MKLTRKNILLVFLLLISLLIHFFAGNSQRVESLYSNSLFVSLSSILRFITGKFDFSVGDILYGMVFVLLFYRFFLFLIKIFQKKINRVGLLSSFKLASIFCLLIYIVFNFFWGINYNRRGIVSQIGINLHRYDVNELKVINKLLTENVNLCKSSIIKGGEAYPDNYTLFIKTREAYILTADSFPFLKYKHPSIKSSMWGWLGNYWGFTGYYNPFTGEAQLNTTVPKFILPFACCHEVAHQLGYAKEKEANFVAFLVSKTYNDSLFLYSTYLNLFFYANRNLYMYDSIAAKQYRESLSVDVKNDIQELVRFNNAHRNFMEPFVTKLYDLFLRSNQQPQGMLSYDEVTTYLVGYFRRYGGI